MPLQVFHSTCPFASATANVGTAINHLSALRYSTFRKIAIPNLCLRIVCKYMSVLRFSFTYFASKLFARLAMAVCAFCVAHIFHVPICEYACSGARSAWCSPARKLDVDDNNVISQCGGPVAT